MGLRQQLRLEMEQVVAGLSWLSGLCTRERSESSLPRTFDNEGTSRHRPASLSYGQAHKSSPNVDI